MSDTDGDGLLDGQERGLSNPHCVDTDGDGLDDGEEFALLEDHPCLDLAEPDSDGDYLTDFDEIRGVFGDVTNPCVRTLMEMESLTWRRSLKEPIQWIPAKEVWTVMVMDLPMFLKAKARV